MNAFLRAITGISLNVFNVPVLGVRNGYSGLVTAEETNGTRSRSHEALVEQRTGQWGLIQDKHKQQFIFMDHPSVSGIVGDGGIILGSARCLEFREKRCERRSSACWKTWASARWSSSVATVAHRCQVARGGKQPAHHRRAATIDNDLEFTEMALGVDTAVHTLVWAVDHFKDTARSHRRVMVLETMGASSGESARLAAIASGAEVVVTPNKKQPFTQKAMQELAASIEHGFDAGRSHTIVLDRRRRDLRSRGLHGQRARASAAAPTCWPTPSRTTSAAKTVATVIWRSGPPCSVTCSAVATPRRRTASSPPALPMPR